LLVTVNGYAGWMDLHKAGVGKESAFFVTLPCCRPIASHGIRRKEKYIAVSSGSNNYSVCSKTFHLSGYQVACYNAPRFPIDQYPIQHLMARIHLDVSCRNLAVQCLISTKQELLTCLPAGIEGAAYQCPSKRAVSQQATIFPTKRDTLGYTLIDDIVGNF